MNAASFLATAAAVADPTRFRMLLRLSGGPLCVGQLAEVVGITQPAVTYHVGKMREAGLVVTFRQGRCTIVRRRERRWAVVEAVLASEAWEDT